MKRFEEIKNEMHDASGIDKPEEWLWSRFDDSGIYYPDRKIPESMIKTFQSSVGKMSQQEKNELIISGVLLFSGILFFVIMCIIFKEM